MKARKWTEEEVLSLREMFIKGIPDEHIAQKLNRTKQSIMNKRQKAGIKNPPFVRYTVEGKKRMREKPTGELHCRWKGGKRVSTSGYYEILLREHHRARKNGYVFEHILVVEKRLGRQLIENEVVHHIDGNKQNNSPINLVVMTQSEHAREHLTGKRSGVYKVCPICGNSFYVKKSHENKRITCGNECAGILFSKYYTNNPRDYRLPKEEKLKIQKEASFYA